MSLMAACSRNQMSEGVLKTGGMSLPGNAMAWRSSTVNCTSAAAPTLAGFVINEWVH